MNLKSTAGVFACNNIFYFGGEKGALVDISVILIIVDKLSQKMKSCSET